MWRKLWNIVRWKSKEAKKKGGSHENVVRGKAKPWGSSSKREKVERKGRTNKVVPILKALFARERNLKGQGIIHGCSKKDVCSIVTGDEMQALLEKAFRLSETQLGRSGSVRLSSEVKKTFVFILLLCFSNIQKNTNKENHDVFCQSFSSLSCYFSVLLNLWMWGFVCVPLDFVYLHWFSLQLSFF